MEPLIDILHSAETNNKNILKNGDFEKTEFDKISAWQQYRNGYEIAKELGRNGSNAVHCKNEKPYNHTGISQSVTLNQQRQIPLLIRGWSKAQNVSGSKDQNYSIYIDITYQDDTPLWGQTGNFSTGTHDWEKQEFMIFPDKPIKQLSIYGIFRNHTGEVWFDDFELIELDKSVSVFDSIPIEATTKTRIIERSDTGIFSTQDGLDLVYKTRFNHVTSLRLDHEEISFEGIPSGFLVRDVASNSGFYGFEDRKCEELGLELSLSIGSKKDHIFASGKISDTKGQDRAIGLVFLIPIDAIGWKWHDDTRHFRIIENDNEYSNLTNIHTGSNGMMSLYPLANISNEKYGLSIALDMDVPAQYRIGYNSYIKAFYIAYDLGLAKETDDFPSSAPFKFVIYRTDPDWGFRSAVKRLYELFPDYFVCRSKDQGIWMPFTDVSTVQGWEDFGFKYHEGNNNVPFDDSANILSFRYTEPSTWWMRMAPEIERTDENITKMVSEYAKSDDSRFRNPAEATLISGSFDEQGRYQYQVLDTPWCNGAVFSLNPNPYIPGNSEAKMKWNDEIKDSLYGSDAKGIQDGEYLDSLEGYVTANENFRRDHFHYVTVPLTFSSSSKKPVIHKASSVYEFSKWLANDVHNMGKLMFANSVPHNFAFLCPFFDAMGTEMDWIGSDGSWRPASDEWMNFKRIMCYQKPYLFLMNTNYSKFTVDLVEKYFQRSLFYGMFPSMFSHNASDDPYWRAPDLYNRDRDLFKRYIPMIKMIAEAGWEPITYAITDNDSVYVERFGPDSKGNVYLTIMNDPSEMLETTISIISGNIFPLDQKLANDLISGESINIVSEDNKIKLSIKMLPEQVRLLVFRND